METIKKIVRELEEWSIAINKALASLKDIPEAGRVSAMLEPATSAPATATKKRRLSPAARKKISAATKARWARTKEAETATATVATKKKRLAPAKKAARKASVAKVEG